MLPSDCKVFLDELLREDLLYQPSRLLGSDSYHIGTNGLWMMNHSRLQSLGGVRCSGCHLVCNQHPMLANDCLSHAVHRPVLQV